MELLALGVKTEQWSNQLWWTCSCSAISMDWTSQAQSHELNAKKGTDKTILQERIMQDFMENFMIFFVLPTFEFPKSGTIFLEWSEIFDQ
jgi:hypothetical protein